MSAVAVSWWRRWWRRRKWAWGRARGGARTACELTWTCHVCQESRLDKAIGVFRRSAPIGAGRLTVSVRYCLDRPACREGAEAVAQRWLDRVAA